MANKQKKKGKVMSLSQFHSSLADDTATPGSVTGNNAAPQNIVRMNWADEMEALDDGDAQPISGQFVFDRSKLPTAPKSVRQSEIDLEMVPKRPPFRAYLSNISFEADEEKIRLFFKELKVATVHLSIDQGGRSKGSGYIDFEDRDSLIAALNKNETTFNNRPLRINLIEYTKSYDRQGGSGGGGYMQRDSDEPLKSDENNWRREREPEPETSYPQRSGDRYGGERRGGYGDRQQGGYGDRQQGGSRYGDRQQSGYGDRQQGGSRYGDRQQSDYGHRRGGYGENRGSGYGGRGGRQDEGQERRQYGGYNRGDGGENRSEGENAWTRSTEPTEPAREATSTELPKERPKLQLQPRTLPVEQSSSTAPASSIFGSAKPVNTAAREREIEERIKENQSAEDGASSQHGESEQPKQAENAWKSRPTANLFHNQETSVDSNKRTDSQGGNRSYSNRDGGNRGDRRGDYRGGSGRQNNDSRGDYRGGRRNYSDKPERTYHNYNNNQHANEEPQDIGYVNKFANLQVDVDEVE